MLNVIAVMGRIVRDPELRKTTTGISTTTFTIACDRSYVKPGEERQTDFIEIVAWRGTAEFACKYFRKGQLVAVTGSLQTRTYEDKQGNKRKVYEVVADNIHFVGSKNDNQQTNNNVQFFESEKQLSIDDEFSIIDDSEDLPF